MFRQKWMQAGVCVLISLSLNTAPVYAQTMDTHQEPIPTPSLKITADAAVLMDAATGDILYDKNAHKQRPPASTTKIITAILGLELGKPDELVVVSEKAASVGESTIHLDPGEKILLYELVTGAMVKSGNDACVAIGEHIAGTEEHFIRLMNQKAFLLGARNTKFENTNGLPGKNHVSTAYDLALMARYGLQIPAFTSITRLKETEIHFIEPDFFMNLKNTNRLLWSYPYSDGVKTGTTNAAGKCLVAAATKDGRQLIAVVLHAPNRFGDAQKLLEWGFDETETLNIIQAGETIEFPAKNTEPVKAFAQNPVDISILKKDKEKLEKKIVWTRDESLPINAGEVLGAYEVWLNGGKLSSTPLYAESPVKQKGRLTNLLEGK
ncbi:D-alanyl-D-alanine carboxypeptidase family protein [Desulfitobacterium sp. PCE1]|uniref:D-alanyl-D-alanine carboxypeptidase family protein n=1 Tax=Desulfitobacterium sp. PCE1 TaxID=146907 RepID=UPI0003724623|nr:D-alanyl-D-alanine carboxypeptidase family protein [Desulfitobacterium sp. PCE1]